MFYEHAIKPINLQHKNLIKMQLITAPEPLEILHPSIFLAGSIEQDRATRWQDTIIATLAKEKCTILNPRRKHWDSSWDQSLLNLHFNQQVNWELTAMEMADLIFMYFDPATKSPVTLLELGLFATSKKLVVCCPNGFWRKGNVDFICKKYNIEQLPGLENFTVSIADYLA